MISYHKLNLRALFSPRGGITHCARWMQKQVAAKGTESILKKRSGRLCLWISPFWKRESTKSGDNSDHKNDPYP